MKTNVIEIPQEVTSIVAQLAQAGYEAYPVGGCVRDMLAGVIPNDWDVATSAVPERIQELFLESFYENKFLTVTVHTGSSDSTLKEVEITTFRAEGSYTDKRHPDEVNYAKTLKEDLARRDFTVNAMAFDLSADSIKVIDPFNGRSDLEHKRIRAVGVPAERFGEDALRMLRAVRLSAQLGFEIEEATKEAIHTHGASLEYIAKERVRDEFFKMLITPRGREGVEMLHELDLLRFIAPELEQGIGVENRPRIFTIWEHNLKALEYGVKTGYSLDVRIAALLHDVGKPATKGPMKNNEWTFYGHDIVGGRMAAAILERLHCSRRQIERIATLIRWHLFKYDPDEGVTDSSVRRLIRRVGPENMSDLVKLRICDRMGMGVPKAVPYRLRHFQFRVEKILREEEEPTPKMLKINGNDVMKVLGIEPGPKIGRILEVLLQEIIDEPVKNDPELLAKRAKELSALSDDELAAIADKAESKVELAEEERVSSIKAKYWVK